MEFRLPEIVAKQFVDYDEAQRLIEKQRKRSQQQERGSTLKRSAKLNFPHLEIFFDLDLETIEGVYKYFCSHTADARFMRIVDTDKGYDHLIVWDRITDPNKIIPAVDRWDCWKIVDKECPLQLRRWFSGEDTYESYSMDKSLAEFKVVVDNPFSRRYKKERDRAEAIELFFKSCSNNLNLDKAAVGDGYGFAIYRDIRFFEEVYYAKGFNSDGYFVPALWLNRTALDEIIRISDLVTQSTIVNSSFYQKLVNTVKAKEKKNLIETKTFVRTNDYLFSFIYLFLYFYPEEYDRSVALANDLLANKLPTYMPHLYSFYDLRQLSLTKRAEFLEWFRTNITPQMFSHWIVDQCEIMTSGTNTARWDSTLADTIKMIVQVWNCLNNPSHYVNSDVAKKLKEHGTPKRWRLEETHEHYSVACMQMENKLVDLPTDLIPGEKVFYTALGQIKMFQPKTNHEVIQWGRAVRNCVGSAGYDKRVLEKKAFLVFAELDGKPWLTSLLTVNMSMLHVGQTVSIRNQSLTKDQLEIYHRCLQDALNSLAESLESTQLQSAA